MIYELWQKKFDIHRLQKHLFDFVLPLEATYQSPAFGGWSVLSSDGSHTDGWHNGHTLYANTQPNTEYNIARLAEVGGKHSAEYVIPTDICHGYMEEVIKTIEDLQLFPRRARIIQLAAESESIWHRDAANSTYAVRMHIPLLTNDFCYFETENEKAHLPADGSVYFLYVNRIHRVINNGKTHRYHLVMDITDKSNVTTYHRYQDFYEVKEI